MSDIVLQTFNLSKQFGDVTAVAGIDLPVYRGEVFGFLGPNGAGKTTTIGMALGLIHPTAGRVEIFGEPVTPGRTRPLRRVGALVGDASLLPYLSGRENLRLLARLYPGVGERQVEAMLDRVGLAQAAARPVKGYSTGMKQRLGLGAALIHEPALVILDEPTNGLDPAGMREMRALVRGLADAGITVFLSSHLLHEVEHACDRVAVLKRGRIVAQGRVADLLGHTQVVRLRVPSAPAAQHVLQTIATPETTVRINGSTLEVSGLSVEVIVRQLATHDIYPSEVVPVGHDLEDIFLELTQEQGG